jgi:hypothetical protein
MFKQLQGQQNHTAKTPHTHSYQLKSVLKCGVIFHEILGFFFSIERLVNFHLTIIHYRV